jgi:formate/nitrite transporter FocA (FNT family)
MLGQLSPALSDCLSLQELARELMCADQSSHHMLTRVANLRTLYQKRFDFRRRSGQVLTQIHAQAMLLVGLYLALSIFTALQYGWEKFLALRLMSALLFALGLIMIFYLGKKIRWKV